jgi:hypothetical protein
VRADEKLTAFVELESAILSVEPLAAAPSSALEFGTRPLLRLCFGNLAGLRIEIVACSPHRIPTKQH